MSKRAKRAAAARATRERQAFEAGVREAAEIVAAAKPEQAREAIRAEARRQVSANPVAAANGILVRHERSIFGGS